MPLGPMAGAGGYAPPPPPVSGAHAAPPPPGPPPPPIPAGASHITAHKMSSAAPAETNVVNDARSDLLAAIRMGKSCTLCVRQCLCHINVCVIYDDIYININCNIESNGIYCGFVDAH